MAGCKPLAGDFARAGAGGEAGKRGSGEAGPKLTTSSFPRKRESRGLLTGPPLSRG